MGVYQGNNNYDEDVYILELTDPVKGGIDGEANKAVKDLANRTSYLKTNEIGMVSSFAMPTAPNGWAKCNGLEVDRVGDYANLFALIGIRFGRRIESADTGVNDFTLTAHGFSTGDTVNIQNFWPNNTNFQVEFSGVQIDPADTIYVRADGADQFSIHPTLLDATNDTNRADIVAFDAAQNYPVIEYIDKLRLPDIRGVFVRGWTDDSNTDPNRQIGELVDDIAGGFPTLPSIALNYCIKYQ